MSTAACPTATESSCPLTRAMAKHSRSEEKMTLATHLSYFKHHDSLTLRPASKEKDDDAGSTTRTENNLTSSSASAVSSSHTRATGRQSVSFGSVEITSFPIVLSDNPGGKMGGPSIGLGPKPLSIPPATFDLDIYEAGRAGRRRKPGTMLAPPSTRYDWVKEAGYTTSQIRQNTKEINRIKKQRAISRKSKGLLVIDDLREWIRAKAKPSCLHRSSIRAAKEEEDHKTTLDPLDTPSNASIQSRICSSRFSRPLRAPSA